MARKKTDASSAEALTTHEVVTSIKHAAKRKNIPAAGLEAQGRIEDTPRIRYEYNPHLPPVLRSASEATGSDRLPELLQIARQRALSAEEAELLANALRRHEPWLEWSGKREKPWFEVEPVALHIHERVSTQAILKVLAREDVNRDLFADPQQTYAQAVQFYQYDVDWANRLILGDSLQVMASLARREDLAGKVQMIYVDPPYGIKFASNFQPQLGQRDVKDRESDLTREPEMVKAYRDTWTLGIHSYLAYLRDRLTMARELLADTGSIFVQISDENLHRVRCVMDEVFGPRNAMALITFVKTSAQEDNLLPRVCDYLLWYARDIEKVKYRQTWIEKSPADAGASEYNRVQFPDLVRRRMTDEEEDSWITLPEGSRPYRQDNIVSQRPPGDFPVEFEGQTYRPITGYWKSGIEGINRLVNAGRLERRGKMLSYVRFFDDFPVRPIANFWTDARFSSRSEDKAYVVQTAAKVIQRCLLMTTDPGDLVLDPTCGSGTTAYVAEQWGRRWITCDTSRVALALAKQRLLTARFTYYQLRPLNAEDVARNPKGTWLRNGDGELRTFQCKTVPHITLKSIARNISLDPIFAKHEPILADKLAALNAALAAHVTAAVHRKLAVKLETKARTEGVRAVTEADCRRWLLPGTKPVHITEKKAVKLYERIPPQAEWRDWEVPFDTDPDWPQPLQDALSTYRSAWRAKMDEVNACIAANAIMEELVDKPEEVKGVVRVSGPFTVEGVIALEDGPDTPIGGAPEELDSFDPETGTTGDTATTNAEAHLDKVIRLLKASGVDFPSTPGSPAKNIKFSRLEPVTGASLLHAEGEWDSGGDATATLADRRVAVSIGPEVGNLTAYQVEDVVRSANRRGYDDVVFAAFGFDAAAQAAIAEASHPHLRLHMALIRPDVAMGELLKTQPGSQLFTVFSAPRVKPPQRQSDGQYVVEVEGMDVYDPVSNALYPTDKERIAAWFLDSDYDGRTFCICQAFFPDKTKWAKLARALGDRGVLDEGKFAALSGLVSLPFPRPSPLRPGEPWRIAVKMIDPRGNEGLRVLTIQEP